MKIKKNAEKEKVNFESLNAGDCFIDDEGDLMMKTDVNQDGVQLSNGVVYGDMCDEMVTPVNAEVQVID